MKSFALFVAITTIFWSCRMQNAQPVVCSESENLSKLKVKVDYGWAESLERLTKNHASNTELELFMQSKFRDRAWVAWGGTGSRSLYFLIDDFHQIRCDFDHDQHMISFDIMPSVPWLKGPDGSLVYGLDRQENSATTSPPVP